MPKPDIRLRLLHEFKLWHNASKTSTNIIRAWEREIHMGSDSMKVVSDTWYQYCNRFTSFTEHWKDKKKLNTWVLHELDEHQERRWFEVCSMLCMRYTIDPFLDRIVTCGLKWIICDNRKWSGQWLDRDDLFRVQRRGRFNFQSFCCFTVNNFLSTRNK